MHTRIAQTRNLRPAAASIAAVAIALAGLMPVGTASAQIAPPPGAKPERPERAEPPTPRPVQSPAERQIQPRGETRPAATRPANRRPQTRVEAPDVEYAPIPTNADFTLPVTYVAMAHNPLLGVSDMASLATVLRARRVEMEEAILQDLPTIGRLLAIDFSSINLTDQEAMAEFQDELAAGQALPPLAPMILSSNVLTPESWALVQKVKNEYDQARLQRLQAAGGGLNAMMSFAMQAASNESRFFYTGLAEAVVTHPDEALAAAALDDGEARVVRTFIDEAKAAGTADNAAMQAAAIEALKIIPDEQQRAAVIAALAARGEPAPLEAPDGDYRELTVAERIEIIESALGGRSIDWSAFAAD
ncbi:MAG: hypothetical protein AAF747_09725 [Planctomycetota bacterium]